MIKVNETTKKKKTSGSTPNMALNNVLNFVCSRFFSLQKKEKKTNAIFFSNFGPKQENAQLTKEKPKKKQSRFQHKTY